jgi:hypothetical protein
MTKISRVKISREPARLGKHRLQPGELHIDLQFKGTALEALIFFEKVRASFAEAVKEQAATKKKRGGANDLV